MSHKAEVWIIAVRGEVLVTEFPGPPAVQATFVQRAEAFCRVKGLWKDQANPDSSNQVAYPQD